MSAPLEWYFRVDRWDTSSYAWDGPTDVQVWWEPDGSGGVQVGNCDIDLEVTSAPLLTMGLCVGVVVVGFLARLPWSLESFEWTGEVR